MDFGHLRFVVAVVVTVVVFEGTWSLPSGCRRNGTSYTEGELVDVGEPCLSCVCRKGGLACSLRVCADYLEALPPGCFLVHKANECCPQLFCEGGFSPNGIELRTAKTEGGEGCVINGTTYGEGSAVASWDPCEYCYCAEGELKCVKPRCVQSFEGCRPLYEKSSCCPTHFDCRDPKVTFFTTRVNNFGDVNWKLSKDPLRSLRDPEPVTEDVNDETSSAPEERTTEDFPEVTTKEISEGTTLEARPETTTLPSTESLTTHSFQTTEDEIQGASPTGETLEGSPTAGTTEETTVEVTSQMPSGTEASEEEPKPLDFTETVDGRWNSSQVADDYDAYDYGEPKLPPSLPNLVIFPFVAADAVVKDENAELYEEVQVDRIDDQAVVYKDHFSPPTKTEGGFVPKQPSLESFYELPFLRKKPVAIESPAEGKQTALLTNAFPVKAESFLPEPNSSSGDDQRTNPTSEGISSGESKQPVNEVLEKEMAAEFVPKGNSDRKNPLRTEQTKKPVTVAYKNFVVDFYPDYLVTTTRTYLTSPVGNAPSQQFQKTSPTTPLSPNAIPDPLFELFHQVTLLPTEEVPIPTKATLLDHQSTSTESSFFEHFLKTFLTEDNTPTALSATKHKYSSKIKAIPTPSPTPTTKPNTHSDAVQPNTASTYSSSLTRSEAPPTTPPLTNRTEPPPTDFGDLQDENKLSQVDETPSKIHPNPATLLKLAGCNIYGMMYRIGKVITELSGPCVECLCTDFGVQCNPLEC